MRQVSLSVYLTRDCQATHPAIGPFSNSKQVMDWSIVSAVNNEEVLRNSLLRSPDLQSVARLFVEKGHASAAAAYNSGLEKATSDLVMFVHQDMYLPGGWFARVEKEIARLEKDDSDWGVIGVWGRTRANKIAGYHYWTGIGAPGGKAFEGVIEVETLDEVILIFRKSSGLRFDPNLPGYHLYGSDICLQARTKGKKCYAVSALCVHNTNTYGLLPLQFWQCYWFMRGKWRSQLPIHTPCTVITRWCWPVISWNLARLKNLLLRQHETFERVADPSEVYRKLT
jgi:glycosyltransferase involved in cell wall biosynthesis